MSCNLLYNSVAYIMAGWQCCVNGWMVMWVRFLNFQWCFAFDSPIESISRYVTKTTFEPIVFSSVMCAVVNLPMGGYLYKMDICGVLTAFQETL